MNLNEEQLLLKKAKKTEWHKIYDAKRYQIIKDPRLEKNKEYYQEKTKPKLLEEKKRLEQIKHEIYLKEQAVRDAISEKEDKIRLERVALYERKIELEKNNLTPTMREIFNIKVELDFKSSILKELEHIDNVKECIEYFKRYIRENEVKEEPIKEKVIEIVKAEPIIIQEEKVEPVKEELPIKKVCKTKINLLPKKEPIKEEIKKEVSIELNQVCKTKIFLLPNEVKIFKEEELVEQEEILDEKDIAWRKRDKEIEDKYKIMKAESDRINGESDIPETEAERLKRLRLKFMKKEVVLVEKKEEEEEERNEEYDKEDNYM
jgi:hypothetical protein